MSEDLMLVLASGVCETCGEQGQALFHHRLYRGPLACVECWEKRLKEETEQAEKTDEETDE